MSDILDFMFSPEMSLFGFTDIFIMLFFMSICTKYSLAKNWSQRAIIYSATIGASVGNWLSDCLGVLLDSTVPSFWIIGLTIGCFWAFVLIPLSVHLQFRNEEQAYLDNVKQYDLFTNREDN